MNEKVGIIASPVGHWDPRRYSSIHYPVTNEEIVEEAVRCHQAGAAILHLHARDEKTKLVSSDPKLYGRVIQRVRERCHMLIQITGGIGSRVDPVTGKRIWSSDEERMALLDVDPKPDMIPLCMGTYDYIYPDGYATYFNTPDLLKKFIPAIVKKKLGLEMEIMEVGPLHTALRLAEEGVFDKHMPLLFNYSFNKGYQPATPRQLFHIYDEGKRLFPQAKWTICSREKNYYQMLTLAMSMGCHVVRIGYEETNVLPNGEFAKSNAQLIESVARIARDVGRDVASVEETREILDLPK